MLPNEGNRAIQIRKLFLEAGFFSAFAGVCDLNSCVRQQLWKMSVTCDEMGRLFLAENICSRIPKGEQHTNES